MNREQLAAELIRDEGLCLAVYDDATGLPLRPGMELVGHPTIGIGRALDVNGITADEAHLLLANDIARVEGELQKALPWFAALDDARQRVLVNMAFNLGTAGLLRFHDTLRYAQEGRYELAARAMQDSGWYRQVGGRALRLVAVMRGEVATPEVRA